MKILIFLFIRIGDCLQFLSPRIKSFCVRWTLPSEDLGSSIPSESTARIGYSVEYSNYLVTVIFCAASLR
jgi:hypothetical protein